MKHLYFFLYYMLSLALTHQPFQAVSKETGKKQILLMEKGESRQLSSPLFETVWLSKGGIVSVQDRGSSLHIQAKKEGEVLLNIGGSRLYLIQVLSEENKKKIIAINDLLSNRMGLKVHIVKDQIQIQGQLYRVKDFKDLSQLAQTFNLNYLFSADIDSSLRPKLKAYIHNKLIKTYSNKEETIIKKIPDSSTLSTDIPPFVLLWQKPLTALMPNDKSLDFYHNKLKQLGITVKPDSSLLPFPPLIEIKILLVESSANQSFQTHIGWGASDSQRENSRTTAISKGGNMISRLLNGQLFKQILSEFKAMEDKGKARIFAETVLLNESGKTVHFHSGGEVPIPHFNPENGTQSIKWKPYGIQLNIETKADRNNKIHINTQATISDVNHSQSTRSAPSLKTSRIHSSITIRSGQSLLLSKLIRRQKGKSHSAPLAISRFPLAGSWLSLKGKIKEHTQLNIFITAKIKTRMK